MREVLLRILFKLGSIVVCAIPARYRKWWPFQNDEDLRGPAIISGVIEFLIGAPGTTMYFAAATAAAKAGLGVAGLILNPFSPFVFLFAEGAVRLLAALSVGEILPTLPLAIIAKIHDRIEGKAFVAQLGPLVPDKIERGDGKPWDLRVLSCRAKSHWNPYMTIRFEGEFYQMFSEDISPGPRKFAYLLRRNSATRLVVVVYDYDPVDTMTPESPPRRWKPDSSPS